MITEVFSKYFVWTINLALVIPSTVINTLIEIFNNELKEGKVNLFKLLKDDLLKMTIACAFLTTSVIFKTNRVFSMFKKNKNNNEMRKNFVLASSHKS